MDEVFEQAERFLTSCYEATELAEAQHFFTLFQQSLGDWLEGQVWFALGRWNEPNRDELAADGAQDVFVRIWRTWDRPTGRWDPARGPLRPWLLSFVPRVITDAYRGRPQFAPLLFSQFPGEEEVRPDAVLPAPTPSPLDEVVLADAFDSFLRSLSALDRALFEMKMHEDLTQGEIGRHLGLTDSEVSRRLSRLYEQFAARLRE